MSDILPVDQPDLSTPAGRIAHLKRRQAERDAGITRPADPRLADFLGWWAARQIRREWERLTMWRVE